MYRYSEATDALSAWFVKPTDAKSVDYLFHQVEIVPATQSSPQQDFSNLRGWRARSSHLCIADTYDVEYEFWFRGVALQKWKMEYEVTGPQKDYRIENLFIRE